MAVIMMAQSGTTKVKRTNMPSAPSTPTSAQRTWRERCSAVWRGVPLAQPSVRHTLKMSAVPQSSRPLLKGRACSTRPGHELPNSSRLGLRRENAITGCPTQTIAANARAVHVHGALRVRGATAPGRVLLKGTGGQAMPRPRSRRTSTCAAARRRCAAAAAGAGQPAAPHTHHRWRASRAGGGARQMTESSTIHTRGETRSAAPPRQSSSQPRVQAPPSAA